MLTSLVVSVPANAEVPAIADVPIVAYIPGKCPSCCGVLAKAGVPIPLLTSLASVTDVTGVPAVAGVPTVADVPRKLPSCRWRSCNGHVSRRGILLLLLFLAFLLLVVFLSLLLFPLFLTFLPLVIPRAGVHCVAD